MGKTTVPDYPRGLTFEQVWASIQELRESQRETDRLLKESAAKAAAEADRRAAEADKRAAEADKRMAQLDKQMGKLGNRFGDMIEYMVKPNLIPKFKALGFNFHKLVMDITVKGPNQVLAEIDAFLDNSDTVMIVEIKSKPTITDIKEQVERMARIRIYADGQGDKRQYRGAIAGMVFHENMQKYAFKSGLYVIVPSGETCDIFAPKGEYQPRVW